jgi:hypothetical protein
MSSRQSQLGFDCPHARAILLVFIATAAVALAGLELVRWHHLTQLLAAGFTPWGDDGYYVHNLPGHALTLTRTHSQALIVVAALTAGAAAGVLRACAAALEMHLPFRTVSGYTLLACLLIPVAVLVVAVTARTPERLAIDLHRDILSVSPGKTTLKLSSLKEFDHYWVSAGRQSHEELGAVTYDGDQVDLLPVSSTLHHRSYWEGLCLTNALQDYVSSGGKVFPES